jgi:hypothetical protein
MTAAIRVRRSFAWAAVLGIALAAGLVPAATAADLPAPASRLESPMADMAVIPLPADAPAGTTPMLLVLDADRISPATARLSILERSSSWDRVTVKDIDLQGDDLDARWLVGLGDGRYALVATTSVAARGSGNAVVVWLQIRTDAGSPAMVETGRSRIDRAVEESAPADLDGLGVDQLVLGMRPLYDASGSCGKTSLLILDPATAAVRRSIEVPGRLGGGVVGRFDAAPGDDLMTYAAIDCPPGGGGGTHLLTIRLRDGTDTDVIDKGLIGDVSVIAPPLRLGTDVAGPDRALVALDDELAVVGGRADTPTAVVPVAGVPLVVGPDADAAGPADRLAWLDSDGLHSARLRISRDGSAKTTDLRSLAPDEVGAGRWPLIIGAAANDIRTHGVTSAWFGALAETGCPDLVVPGAIEPCGSGELRSGASWVATRLVTVLPVAGRRTALVAAGIGWNPVVGIPTSPTPAAGGPAGWWRRGPSTPFVLSETRASDVVYFRDFPVPKTTIETTTGKDGMTTMPGFTGTRMFVTVQPLTDDAEEPTGVPGMRDAFVASSSSDAVTRVARIPVPPGNESGRDGAYTRLSLGDIKQAGATPTSRWGVQVVAINDWGEVGDPVVGTVTRDVAGPTLNLETPFTNPIWPFLSHLSGRTEPGSTVKIEDGEALEVDQRGRFTVVTRLAPWPQDIRLAATDESGNTSVAEFSLVGGVDYRRFPWALIIAIMLLAIVAARGLIAAGKRAGGVEATAWSTGVLDEASMPEIEELPPGSGLARR